MNLFSRLFRKQPLVCRDAVELMTNYLDDALSTRDRIRLETHLAACPHCSEYLDQLRKTITATGAIRQDSLPPEAMDELDEIFRQWSIGEK